jgi:alpha-amylase/alpha-mannosidase (GH57 family)
MKRFVCIHAHFYQPPRENPWSGKIELQESSHPFHDWNQRILTECYKPNTEAKILGPKGEVVEVVNNYSLISFNFGPTLLDWMQENAPDTYQKILEADKISQQRFGGHGSAIAQAYNHMIMPLASARDKITQVKWGIKDFEYRFGRKPEGMWLPETAVDYDTLEILVQNGISFTILSPYQASKVKKIDGKLWKDASNGAVDTQQPYLCRLPSGQSIVIFFYDGAIAPEIAFGELLKDGVRMSERFLSAFPKSPGIARLVHTATDGESYGHHHKFGEMALAFCLRHIEKEKKVDLIIYGQYLEMHHPQAEVQIKENTSWSCVHGIERWRSDCSCAIHPEAGWNQRWRIHLRTALDSLRFTLSQIYVKGCARYHVDPWELRNEYISVIVGGSEPAWVEFLRKFGLESTSKEDQDRLKSFLEMQHQAMLMYTSCGWFFDDISGLEVRQILQYAARAIELARQWHEGPLEQEFLFLLEHAKSNIPEMKNGRHVYETYIKPLIPSNPAHV